MIPMTTVKEHDYEPVKGLPAPLPDGESILWQGAPGWRALARRAMRVRMFAAYFAVLIAWSVVSGLTDGSPPLDMAVSALRFAALASAALALLTGYAWLVARTTVYTITTRRVVMRFGVALPVTIQIAFPMIDQAGLNAGSDGAGDIALTLREGQRIAYLLLCPHARPWKLGKAEPTLRGIPDAAAVAHILSRALTASASQPAKAVSIPAAALSGHAAPVPAAA